MRAERIIGTILYRIRKMVRTRTRILPYQNCSLGTIIKTYEEAFHRTSCYVVLYPAWSSNPQDLSCLMTLLLDTDRVRFWRLHYIALRTRMLPTKKRSTVSKSQNSALKILFSLLPERLSGLTTNSRLFDQSFMDLADFTRLSSVQVSVRTELTHLPRNSSQTLGSILFTIKLSCCIGVANFRSGANELLVPTYAIWLFYRCRK